MDVESFVRRLYRYIVTLVPSWRVSDEAWPLDDDVWLIGLGVERNYGGQVMVVALDSIDDEVLPILQQIAHGRVEADVSRIIIVYDDQADSARDVATRALSFGPVLVLAWSDRARLAEHVIRDKP